MKSEEIVLNGMFAQIYARLVMAAINRVHVYYSDLAPVVFGIQFTRVDNKQYNALWDIIRMTMQMDHLKGRLPVAALFVSRANDTKKPGTQFFVEYERLTGKKLSDAEWQALAQDVWNSYAPPEFPSRQS